MNFLKKIVQKLRWIQLKKAQKRGFENEFNEFSSKSDRNFKLDFDDAIPYLNDKTSLTAFDAHYIYHPAWASRIVKEVNPSVHIDISSTLHFCTQLSAFIPVEFYDYRPAMLTLDNLKSLKADLTNLFFESNSIDCISCMHTIEHVGLGRYGDPIDPNGDIKAINELKRVVKPGGTLLFVTPVGKPKIVFNAHRIYGTNDIVQLFQGFSLRNFSLVKDNNEFVNNATIEQAYNENYGCGCFWFIKDK